MIKKKDHDALMKKWEKYHQPYQRWNRLETRMPMFLKHVKNLKGKDVIEFGCNAGVYGYEISKIAKSYIGVDQGKEYINQANETKKYFKMNNATFHAKHVKSFIRDCQKHPESAPKINAIFATFVLYHLSDKETDLIKKYLLPKCDVVVIMTRTSKRSPWKKYNSLKLHKIKNVEKYLKSAGFECKSEMHYNEKKGKKDFGITLAVRKDNADNKGKSDGDRESKDETSGGRGTSGVKQGRIPKGSKVLSSERQTPPEGPDGVLFQVQEAVGDKSLLQDRQ